MEPIAVTKGELDNALNEIQHKVELCLFYLVDHEEDKANQYGEAAIDLIEDYRAQLSNRRSTVESES